MKLIYYIIHTFTGCPREKQTWYRDLKSTCQQCGRVYFRFKKY